MHNPFQSISAKIAFVATYFIFSLIIFVGLIALLFSVNSIKTFIFTLGFILLFLAPVIFVVWGKLNKYFLIITLILVLLSLSQGFQLNNAQDGQFSLNCINCGKYNYNVLNVISERELLSTGYKLAGVLVITDEQLRGFKSEELRYEDSVNINLPSQIPNALIGKTEPKYFLYKPNNAKADKLIIVVHGSAGGFLFYEKYFKQFADKYSIKVAEPVFGWGDWNQEGGVELIFSTYNDLLNKGEITSSTKVILVGLSNGGLGLTRAIYYDDKNIFNKVVYISGVMERNIMELPRFQTNIKGRQIFAIQGEIDDRVLYSYYLQCKKYLGNIEELIFKDGDHFALLNKGQAVINELDTIINK